MSNWKVELEFIDGKSKKFWRARADGAKLTVNFGRIGTDGQTKVKDLADAAEAEAELDKLAASKRKKGYADVAGVATAPTPAAAPVLVVAENDALQGPISLRYEADGRSLELTLRADGTQLHTTLVERYADDDAAAKALSRIRKALVDEGYREPS